MMAKMVFNKKESKGLPFPWLKVLIGVNLLMAMVIIVLLVKVLHG